MNAEFQRITKRDKKAFLSDQCKEIEESNRMGKTRDLFKIIRNNKGTFHAKMGSIKDRNGRDLTEADGEGNGTPLQYSCLENPMDGGAWQAAVHGVTKSRTRLKGQQQQQQQKQKILRRGGKNTQKNYTKNIFTTKIITMM